MKKHTLLSNRQHVVNILVHSNQYLADLKKKEQFEKKGQQYLMEVAPRFDNVPIKPGFNSFTEEEWSKLMTTKAFKALLESREIHYNDQIEFNRYNAEVKDILENNLEYQEHQKTKKAADSESRALEYQKLVKSQEKQIELLESRLAKLEGTSANDHTSKHTS